MTSGSDDSSSVNRPQRQELRPTSIPAYVHFRSYPDIGQNYPLIGPGDPPPFTTYNNRGKAPVLVVADHATPLFPAAMNQLGLPDQVVNKHIAWDIGSDMVARFLADRLDAQAVLSGFSRLIVDPNRQLDDPTAFVEASDGIAIPGNTGLDDAQKALRVQSFFKPYHDQISAKLDHFSARGIVPALISVHSFTPMLNEIVRPWHIGVLWDKDPRIAVPLLSHFGASKEICVGDNEPYSGRQPHDFTVDYHAEPNGLPHVGIEVRQDLVSGEEGARRWATKLADAFDGVLAGADLYRPLSKHHKLASA